MIFENLISVFEQLAILREYCLGNDCLADQYFSIKSEK